MNIFCAEKECKRKDICRRFKEDAEYKENEFYPNKNWLCYLHKQEYQEVKGEENK